MCKRRLERRLRFVDRCKLGAFATLLPDERAALDDISESAIQSVAMAIIPCVMKVGGIYLWGVKKIHNQPALGVLCKGQTESRKRN